MLNYHQPVDFGFLSLPCLTQFNKLRLVSLLADELNQVSQKKVGIRAGEEWGGAGVVCGKGGGVVGVLVRG